MGNQNQKNLSKNPQKILFEGEKRPLTQKVQSTQTKNSQGSQRSKTRVSLSLGLTRLSHKNLPNRDHRERKGSDATSVRRWFGLILFAFPSLNTPLSYQPPFVGTGRKGKKVKARGSYSTIGIYAAHASRRSRRAEGKPRWYST